MLKLKKNVMKYKSNDGTMQDINAIIGQEGTDMTLTKSGIAADAKIVGDKFNKLSEEIDDLKGMQSSGMSTTAINLLISILGAGVYSPDQTENIALLEQALLSSGGSSEGGDNSGGDDNGSGDDSGNGENGGNTIPDVTALPSWISEMQVVEFTPEADTNEAQTFAINMNNEPNIVIIDSDIEAAGDVRDFAGAQIMKASSSGSIASIMWNAKTKTEIDHNTTSNNANISITSDTISITTSTIGTEKAYWRAGHTYKIYCIKTILDISDMSNIPSFANEVYAVEFTPEADTNELQTFNYEMVNEPNAILILSDIEEFGKYRDFVGAILSTLYDSDEFFEGVQIHCTGSSIGSAVFSATCGVMSLADGEMTFQTYTQGGTASYWKAGHKYVILFMNI